MNLPDQRDPKEMRDDTPEPDWQAEYEEYERRQREDDDEDQ